MRQSPEKALLPAGLADVLPPHAAHEAATVERLIHSFAARGYERVKPPLIEFEEALLIGAGAALGKQTFRLMDPVSHRMLGLRADMTTQVSRIAASRLARAPRPLRLCYAGQVLRVQGTQLRSERQFTQVGAELIGSDAEAADVEAIVMAVEALTTVGIARLSVDLNLPPLTKALADHLGFDEATADELCRALDRKDSAAVEELAGDRRDVFQGLLRAAGPKETALERLQSLQLPDAIRAEVERLARVVHRISGELPDLALTVDPVEHRGFEYQTGLSFTIHARGVRGELGRGGRYAADGDGATAQPATGFTLFMDTVMRGLQPTAGTRRVYLPFGADHRAAAKLRGEGWTTIAGLEPVDDARAEAARLGCAYVFADGAVTALRDAQPGAAVRKASDSGGGV